MTTPSCDLCWTLHCKDPCCFHLGIRKWRRQAKDQRAQTPFPLERRETKGQVSVCHCHNMLPIFSCRVQWSTCWTYSRQHPVTQPGSQLLSSCGTLTRLRCGSCHHPASLLGHLSTPLGLLEVRLSVETMSHPTTQCCFCHPLIRSLQVSWLPRRLCLTTATVPGTKEVF